MRSWLSLARCSRFEAGHLFTDEVCVCVCARAWGEGRIGIQGPGRRFGEEKTNIYLMPRMSQALCQVLLQLSAHLHESSGIDRYYFSSFPR